MRALGVRALGRLMGQGWKSPLARALAASLVVLAAAISNADLSIRVEGEGYLRFLKDGRAVYAKAATLSVSGGELKEKSGASLLPPIRTASVSITIDDEGWVWANGSKVSRLILAKLSSPLEVAGDFLVARDRPELGFAGAGGFGRVVAGGNTGAHGQRDGTEAKPSGQLRISISAEATVTGSRFTLGEISQITGAESERVQSIDLGTSPIHGIPLTCTRERILAKIALLGIDKKSFELSMGSSVQIRRDSQVVTRDQIIATARTAAEQKSGLKGELESSDRISDLHVPTGSLELVAESVSLGTGYATVTVGIRVDGKRILGRTIRLSGSMLEPAIQAGASVTVRFISGGLTIELPGRTRTSGAVGQTIEVSVAAEGAGTTVHQATIVAPGLVEVRV